jgi:fructokinase
MVKSRRPWLKRANSWKRRNDHDARIPAATEMNPLPTVVGLGEVLWDLLPSGRQIGGAPANFAYWSHVLGNRAIVASRVAGDDLGRELRHSLLSRGVTDQFLQTDPAYPTGTVKVEVDRAGQPQFEITYPVSWDFLEFTPTWRSLAHSADAVCFGSLAQRSPESRSAILSFLDATRRDALRIFDVNLRQSFYSAEIIADSCRRANLLKLNHDELPVIRELLGLSAADSFGFCEEMVRTFDLKLICVTRGPHGSLLSDGKKANEHPGYQAQVKDTIGSGDAFTAAMVSECLRDRPMAEMNDIANRLGAWVASNSGAMPPVPEDGIEGALSKLIMN